ncbi:MAG TPA: menaquinone biosynthesis protein [Candidatus Methylacidiphilales bacterium]|nr:menaquinone biosynthesis protein [Candidatus Methylacidiphilales bacterium]
MQSSSDNLDAVTTAETQPAPAAQPGFTLGSVPYFNARPLTYALQEPLALLEPSRLATELSSGHLQAALVPLSEALENGSAYHIVNGYAIGSLGSVYSVVLAHMLPVVRLKTIALDPASKTSNQLLRVLLRKYYRMNPVYVSPDEAAEGQLLIGDPAISYRQSHPDERYLDLAQAWHAHTGRPFVFAVWAIRRDTPDPAALAQKLRAAARTGLAARDEIARTPFEHRYLNDHLYYRLEAPQKKAISAFAADLVEIGLLASCPELSYI